MTSIHMAEGTLAQHTDSIPENLVESMTSAIETAKAATDSDNPDELLEATNQLNNVITELGAFIYQATAEQQAAQSPEGEGSDTSTINVDPVESGEAEAESTA